MVLNRALVSPPPGRRRNPTVELGPKYHKDQGRHVNCIIEYKCYSMLLPSNEEPDVTK